MPYINFRYRKKNNSTKQRDSTENIFVKYV